MLAPPPRRRRGECKAEEGLRVLRRVLKYDHEDPPSSLIRAGLRHKRRRKEEKRGGDVLLGREAFQVISLMLR